MTSTVDDRMPYVNGVQQDPASVDDVAVRIPSDKPQDAVVAAWLAAQATNLSAGVGLIVYRSDADIRSVLNSGLSTPPAAQPPLILPFLTEDLLAATDAVREVHRGAALARRNGQAILAATPLSEAALAGSTVSHAEPSELDASGLVARSELAFMLERSCVARVIENDATALYLTPIEARMAAALRNCRIDFQPQVAIGRFRADFLVRRRRPSEPGLIVECDGAGFHEPERDAARDAELRALGHDVLRFSGSQIYRDAPACAAAVEAAIVPGGERSRRAGPNDPELSPRQAEAVVHRDGPARVAAPAGSGKTRVIAARVRHLVATGVAPERICAISFTKKAVGEMRERLQEIADRTRFTTLHSLAKSIAEAAGTRRDLIQKISPGRARSTPTRWQVLKPLLDPAEYQFRASNDLWVDAVTTYRQSFELPDFAGWEEHQPSAERFIEVCSSYDRELRKRNLTDFEGWVHDALRALASDPARRELEAAKFDYWIVDEYQDLPLGKLKLLRLLVAPARNLFVVGDDDQVLYGFAGASPNIFRAFSTEFPGASDYVLDTNFRSRHELVVRTRWLIERNRHRVDKQTQARHPLDGTDRVALHVQPHYDELAASFVRERLAEGVPPEKIAVLFRLRDMAIPVERRLGAAGVRHTRCSHDRFFARESVRALLFWLQLIAGPRGNVSSLVTGTLKWPPRYLRNETVDDLADACDRAQVSELNDVLAVIDAHVAELEVDHQRDALSQYLAAVRSASSFTAPTAILDALGLRALMKNESAGAGQASPIVIHDVLYRLASQFATVVDLMRWIHRESRNPGYDFSSDEEARTAPGAVTLASIHQAKGLEWAHVAVVGPLDGMPDRRALTDNQLEEERRIAYVAATRAEETLLFCASPQYADELHTRIDGLTWADYRAGRTTPQVPAGWSRATHGSTRTHGRSGTRANPNYWDGSVPEGASQRRGVWVLRSGMEAEGSRACQCGLVAWKPPPDATCPDCGRVL